MNSFLFLALLKSCILLRTIKLAALLPSYYGAFALILL
jgi:hypothetical protein